MGTWLAAFCVNLPVLWRFNRAGLEARVKKQRITETYDRIVSSFMGLGVVALPIVAGFDAVRFRWCLLPTWCVYAGLMLHVAGAALSLWAILVNPYMEKVVRIQTERRHHVITGGPYGLVRHPLYLGTILLMAGIPLILGSAWAFLPVGVIGLTLVIRLVFEERTLRDGLPGYAEYIGQTRCRIVPWVW
jgi:protein-S-isoprenylcysteine O-methyltransferase Ste14